MKKTVLEMTPQELVEYLASKNWRQEQIALEIDLSQPTISRVMKGAYKRPSFVLVDRLRQLVLRLEEL